MDGIEPDPRHPDTAGARKPAPPTELRPERRVPASGEGHPDGGVPTQTIRLGGRGHGPSAVVVAVALFFAVAWIKPWPAAAPPLAPISLPTPAPAAPTADPLSNLKYHCQEPSGWRVYARERWGGLSLRSWRTLDPARAASGPLDPEIPLVPLGPSIVSLGYCSPWSTAERPPAAAEVAAWRLTPRTDVSAAWGATPIELRTTAPTPATVVAALYSPPRRSDRSARSAGGWEAGRWVFAVRGPAYERWWAIEIQGPLLPGDLVPAGG